MNAEATRGTAPAREMTVQFHDDGGELAAGMSGWPWGLAGGIGMTWVREDTRGAGLGTRLLSEFEAEARARGCTHVFTTSFTFQAPGFYERHGYREIFRWDELPVVGASDVHFHKDLWVTTLEDQLFRPRSQSAASHGCDLSAFVAHGAEPL